MTEMICENCRYWSEQRKGVAGECHAIPPIHGAFPVTSPSDWCGEFRLPLPVDPPPAPVPPPENDG